MAYTYNIWGQWDGTFSIQSNFQIWQACDTILLHPTLNLRPGLNSVAFSTYIVKFPAFKLVSFMAYTYNIWGQWDGTRCQPGTQSNFWIWQACDTILLHPTLNLRPGLNSVAFSTYIVKFPAFKLVSFMAYTYNIQGWWDGTRQCPLLAQPHDGSPITAPQPHSNSHFVYI